MHPSNESLDLSICYSQWCGRIDWDQASGYFKLSRSNSFKLPQASFPHNIVLLPFAAVLGRLVLGWAAELNERQHARADDRALVKAHAVTHAVVLAGSESEYVSDKSECVSEGTTYSGLYGSVDESAALVGQGRGPGDESTA